MPKKVVKYLRSIHWRPSRRDLLVFGLGALIMLAGLRVATGIHHAIDKPLAPESPEITITWLPTTVTRYRSTIQQMGKRYDIDPNLIAIIMSIESGGYAAADSGVATGLMQVTPGTGAKIANQYLKDPVRYYDLKNPVTSIEFGTALLAHLRDEFGNSDQGPSWNSTVELVAAAYNGGDDAAASVRDGTGLHDPQTVVYSRDAFNLWRERHAKSSPTFDRWKERGGQDLIDKAQAEASNGLLD